MNWRSRSIETKQNTEHWGQLPSGVPYTFLKNSFKILKTILTISFDVREFAFAVVGGDDDSVCLKRPSEIAFDKSRQLKFV